MNSFACLILIVVRNVYIHRAVNQHRIWNEMVPSTCWTNFSKSAASAFSFWISLHLGKLIPLCKISFIVKKSTNMGGKNLKINFILHHKRPPKILQSKRNAMRREKELSLLHVDFVSTTSWVWGITIQNSMAYATT